MKKITKIFIANRGEIAQRIFNTAQRLGIKLAIPVSKADEDLDYVHRIEHQISVGEELNESFLSAEKMVEAALESGADAIHPGYGFLSENAHFAQLCVDNGLVWIGPNASLIAQMGNKQQAIETATQLDIPVLKGRFGSPEKLKSAIKASDFPLILKASHGGGGKGIHIVNHESELDEKMENAAREALSLFGTGDIFVEKYIPKARHIEVQILGDKHGHVVHLFDRECSVQRRFQKLIEEAPAPGLSDELRTKLYNAALKICHYIAYDNAGTVEFIVDGDDYYFLEMNTRIQVEHPVSEEITGIDLIEQQIRIAEGQELPFSQNSIHILGHAIETRIYAEDAENHFAPSPGRIQHLFYPTMEGLRIETAIRRTQDLAPNYDPLICKVISSATSREDAIEIQLKALNKTDIFGIKTTAQFLVALIQSKEFKQQTFYTKLIDEDLPRFVQCIDEERTLIKNLAAGLFCFLTYQKRDQGERAPAWKEIGYWRAISMQTVYVNNKRKVLDVVAIGEDSITLKDANDCEIAITEITLSDHEMCCVFNAKQYLFYSETGFLRKVLDCRCKSYAFALSSFQERTKEEARQRADLKGCVEVKASLPGKVIKLNVKEGNQVLVGESLLVLESMKIENNIAATNNGIVTQVNINEGQQLNQNDVLLIIKDN